MRKSSSNVVIAEVRRRNDPLKLPTFKAALSQLDSKPHNLSLGRAETSYIIQLNEPHDS